MCMINRSASKKEFQQFLLAVGKGNVSGAVKLAVLLRVVGPL